VPLPLQLEKAKGVAWPHCKASRLSRDIGGGYVGAGLIEQLQYGRAQFAG
jgi:hypothetical protein